MSITPVFSRSIPIDSRWFESLGVLFALFLLTYLYALSGLNSLFLIAAYPALYVGSIAAVLSFGYDHSKRSTTFFLGAGSLVIIGLAVAGFTVGPHPVRDPLVLLVLVVTAILAVLDTSITYGREAAILLAVFGLAVLFGAFPSAGGNVANPGSLRSVSVVVSTTNPGSTLFGVKTAALIFSGTGYGVVVNLGQAAIGTMAYAVGRGGMSSP